MAATQFWFLVGFVVLRSCSLDQTTSANVTLTCPSYWSQGKTETLICRIRMSSFSRATCEHFTSVVKYQFRRAGVESSYDICTVKDLVSSCQDAQFQPDGCRCKGSEDGQYVLEYFVTASETTHEGGTWMCVPNCKDADLENVFLDSSQAKKALSCGPVMFGQPQQTTVQPQRTTVQPQNATICPTSSAVAHVIPPTSWAFLLIAPTMLLLWVGGKRIL